MVAVSSFAIVVASLWSLCSFPTLHAYNDGAGGCDGNKAAVSSQHLFPGFTSGTLATGNIAVLLDGKALTPGTPASFTVGEDHTLSLQCSTGFKGLLVRMGGVGTSALSAIDATPLLVSRAAPAGDPTLVKNATLVCTPFGVSGVTHSSRVVKSQARVKLRHGSIATNLRVDITIVIRNDGVSEFYYSQFVLNAITATPTANVAPTSAPIVSTTKPIAPSLAPVSGPPTIKIPVKPGNCFSESNTVEVLNKGLVSMKDLRIGDKVRGANGKMVSVYSFGHHQPKVKANYLQIHAKELSKPLEISKDHLIFVNGTAVPASSITRGYKLDMGHQVAEVTKVKMVTRTGIFAPFTTSGTVMVNGVAVSSYVTLQEESQVLTIGAYRTGLSMHWLSHVFETPHRLFCKVRMDLCKMESYTDDGISHWAAGPLHVVAWLLQQNEFVVVAIFIPALLLGMFLYMMEIGGIVAGIVAVLLVLVSAAGLVYQVGRSRNVKSKKVG